MKKQVTWTEYLKIKDAIWSKYCNDESLSHEVRGEAIKAELEQLEVVK